MQQVLLLLLITALLAVSNVVVGQLNGAHLKFAVGHVNERTNFYCFLNNIIV